MLTAPLDTVAVKVIGVSKLGLITLPAVSIKLAFEELQLIEVPSSPIVGSVKSVVTLVDIGLLPSKSPISKSAKASSTDCVSDFNSFNTVNENDFVAVISPLDNVAVKVTTLSVSV